MREFEDYSQRYAKHLTITRGDDDILEVRFHGEDGGSLHWGISAHRTLTEAFRDIALDRDYKVVLITGTGEEFLGPRASEASGRTVSKGGIADDARMWERDAFSDAREMTNAILDIPVPVMSTTLLSRSSAMSRNASVRVRWALIPQCSEPPSSPWNRTSRMPSSPRVMVRCLA